LNRKSQYATYVLKTQEYNQDEEKKINYENNMNSIRSELKELKDKVRLDFEIN